MFFELSLVPISILTLRWGVQPERVRAVYYMVLYTLGGSLPFLVFILACFHWHGSFFIGFRWNLLRRMGY